MQAHPNIEDITFLEVRDALIANDGSIPLTCSTLKINEQNLLDLRKKYPDLERYVSNYKRGNDVDLTKEELKQAFEENEYAISHTAYALGISMSSLRSMMSRRSMGNLATWQEGKRKEFLKKYGRRDSAKRQKLNGKNLPSVGDENVITMPLSVLDGLNEEEKTVSSIDRVTENIESVNRRLTVAQSNFANVVDLLDDRLNHMHNMRHTMIGAVSLLSCAIGSLATYLIITGG